MEKTKGQILNLIDSLTTEGESLKGNLVNIAVADRVQYMDEPRRTHNVKHIEQSAWLKWTNRIVILTSTLKGYIDSWTTLEKPYMAKAVPVSAEILLAALYAIREAVETGLLVSIDRLLQVEIFDDLIEAAQHLNSQGYWLSAGVNGRIVLERYLCKMCDRMGISITGKETTKSLIESLYKNGHINLVRKKEADALASIGNHCAHGKDPIPQEAMNKFLLRVSDFVHD
jgi:hypothetical protein